MGTWDRLPNPHNAEASIGYANPSFSAPYGSAKNATSFGACISVLTENILLLTACVGVHG